MSKLPRGRRSARRMNVPEVRAALVDGKVWTGVGLVYKPSGETSHYEIDPDIGVLVHVQLMPNEEPLQARLGGLGSGGADGVWRIPPVGTEVIVVIPGGEIDGDPAIVATLSSGGTPDELDGDTLVIRAPKVVILATDGAVEVGDTGLAALLDGVVHGRGYDTFTGAQYGALGSTSTTLKAKK